MSRENRRRRVAAAMATGSEMPAAIKPAPSPPRPPVEETGTGLQFSWKHVLIGLLAGEALLLVLGDGGLALGNALFGPSNGIDGGVIGVATFVAVIAGGFLAARLAGHHGLAQGVAVGIGFIIVAMVFQFAQEAKAVHDWLADGHNTLLDLGPMNLGGLISGDLIALFGGSMGGWFARRS